MDSLIGNSKFDFDFFKKYIFILFVLIVGLNVFFFDVQAITLPSKKNQPQSLVTQNLQSTSTPVNDLTCPQSCVDLMTKTTITTASATITPTPSFIPTPSSTQSSSQIATSTPTVTSSPQTSSVKEFFVPMGQGNSSASDWAVVPGIAVSIDPANYGNISSVTFEATIRIPNGNETVDVRLYNANTYQSIPDSDLTLSSGTPTLLISKPIALTSGNNMYEIQLKTQLQYPAYIDQARLHIKVY